MTYNKQSNEIGEMLAVIWGSEFLDANNILWKLKDGKWIGKRSVWTFDYRASWIENTTIENIESYWCGKESDYNEIFTRQ